MLVIASNITTRSRKVTEAFQPPTDAERPELFCKAPTSATLDGVPWNVEDWNNPVE
jgi:hypothetical protein